MAQENADRLHAALCLGGEIAADRIDIVSATGIDLASFTVIGAGRYEFDLLEGISDAELIVSLGDGAIPFPQGEATWQRADPADPDLKRFRLNTTNLAGAFSVQGVCISFWRIPPIEPVIVNIP